MWKYVHRALAIWASCSSTRRADTAISQARWAVQGLLFPVWGAMTAHDGRVLLKRPDGVVSWWALFEAERMRPHRHASCKYTKDPPA